MHPIIPYVFVLLGEKELSFEGGTMNQGRNGGERNMFTRFALNAFTPAVSPTFKRHTSLDTQSNSMILGLLESSGCLVSKECNFAAIGQSHQKLLSKA